MNIVPLKKILSALGIEILHTKSDGWMTALCPFARWTHAKGSDTKPSFFVRADDRKRSGFNCYACHQRGNIAALIMGLSHHRKKTYTRLVIQAEMAELEAGTHWKFDEDGDSDIPDEPLNEAAMSGLYPPAYSNAVARDYLKARCISPGTAELLGLLYDEDSFRVLFPVRDRRGRLYGYSGRTVLDDEALEGMERRYQGKVRDLFGLQKAKHLLGADRVDGAHPIMLVEGLFAYAAAFDEHIDKLVSPVASMGSTLSRAQADTLVDWGKPVYVFYDNDSAGSLGIHGGKTASGYVVKGIAHNLASEVPVFIPEWPEGYTDPDDLTFEHVERMIKGAKLLTPM